MKTIVSRIFLITSVVVVACRNSSLHQPSAITFYAVELECNAAPEIGCGSRSKPALLELEQHPAVREAWLNRAGTMLAIVWDSAGVFEETARSILRRHSISFQPMSGREVPQWPSDVGRTWYRGADVDKLSTEEARVIAHDAVGYALNEKLIRQNEAQVIEGVIAKYFQDKLTSVQTAAGLCDPAWNTNVRNELISMLAGYIGQSRASMMYDLYMNKSTEENCCNSSCSQQSKLRRTSEQRPSSQ